MSTGQHYFLKKTRFALQNGQDRLLDSRSYAPTWINFNPKINPILSEKFGQMTGQLAVYAKQFKISFYKLANLFYSILFSSAMSKIEK